jgi:hypothetical protein
VGVVVSLPCLNCFYIYRPPLCLVLQTRWRYIFPQNSFWGCNGQDGLGLLLGSYLCNILCNATKERPSVTNYGPRCQRDSTTHLDIRIEAKAELGDKCQTHGCDAGCALPEPGFLDIFVACFPCRPYSSWNKDRHTSNPRNHTDFPVGLGEAGSVITLIDKLRPKRIVGENVRGFGQAFSKSDSMTGLMLIREKIKSFTDSEGNMLYTGFAVTIDDSSDWVDMLRWRYPPPNK